jgi:hypothetical protein
MVILGVLTSLGMHSLGTMSTRRDGVPLKFIRGADRVTEIRAGRRIAEVGLRAVTDWVSGIRGFLVVDWWSVLCFHAKRGLYQKPSLYPIAGFNVEWCIRKTVTVLKTVLIYR